MNTDQNFLARKLQKCLSVDDWHIIRGGVCSADTEKKKGSILTESNYALTLVMGGTKEIDIWQEGRPITKTFGEADIFFETPGTIKVEHWCNTHELFGLSLRDDLFRYRWNRPKAHDKPYPSQLPRWYHTAHAPAPEVIHLFHALDAITSDHDEDKNEAIQSVLKSLLGILLYYLKRDVSTITGKANHTWKMVRSYIHEHWRDGIDRNSLSHELKLHPNYLSTLVHRHSGLTLLAYINRLRIEHAKLLLRNTTMNISEIGYRCGWESNISFSRAFRRETGIPPGRYRN